MGLFQKALETYDAHSAYVGREIEGHQILVPISHILAQADLEITLESDGRFSSVRQINRCEPKIFIPATEDSAGRTNNSCPHPLCDQLCYLAPYNAKRHTLYINQLADWAKSPYSHPMLLPILSYIKGGTILSDLAKWGVVTLRENGIPKDEKAMVRWRVHGFGAPNDGCWQQDLLVKAFQDWYASLRSDTKPVLCMISGNISFPAKQHLKGIIPTNGNAKLISSNDKQGFSFRGRFTEDTQAVTISYLASQKAHNALQWIIAEQGVQAVFGGRTFLCWNPQGIPVCHAAGPFGNPEKIIMKASDYRQELKNTLAGLRSQLPPKDSGVIIASFDAATKGRLAVTYYKELMGSDYLQRLCDWDMHCCWYGWKQQILSPPLQQIVNCAFGIQVKEKGRFRFKTPDKRMSQQMQRLISCRIDRAHIPLDVMQSLFHRASSLLTYDSSLRSLLLSTACSVIQKYRYDIYKEECDMELKPEKTDRSYQFGRLLAVLEKAERDTYSREETREPNAIRMQSAFCRRPLLTATIIEEQLERAYFPRLKSPAFRAYYKNLIGEIIEQISAYPKEQWNAPLKETYLMGYYLQRRELYSKKSKPQKEDN